MNIARRHYTVYGIFNHLQLDTRGALQMQDRSVYGHFGPRTLRHHGMTEVSRHFGTGTEVSYGRFGTRQSTYMEDQSHCILCDSFLPLVTLGVNFGQFQFEYYAKAYPRI